MSDATYKLSELAHAAGTSARTVRYYVQRGLLPAPEFRGKDTGYGREHLVRLRAIRRLQEAYLPLDAIAAELERRSLRDIERLADGEELPAGFAKAEGRERETAKVSVVLPARAIRRFELAPGVVLDVADDAPAESKRLVEELLENFGTKWNVEEGG